MPQTIVAPNAAELKWIEQNLRRAHELVQQYAHAAPDQPLEPRLLDTAFATWLAGAEGRPENPNDFINAFGIAFGQYFVDSLGMHWAIVSDEHGTEIAVHKDPGSFLIFPPNLVGKRYVSKETGFLEPIYEFMKKRIEMVSSQAAKRPWWKFGKSGN